jgi:hypothetical protein
MEKKTMEKPEAICLEAIACAANPVSAAAIFGAAMAAELAALAATCNVIAIAGTGVSALIA